MKVQRDGRSFTVDVTPDGAGLVSHAGAALVAGAASRLGFTAALSRGLAGLRRASRSPRSGPARSSNACWSECAGPPAAPRGAARERRAPRRMRAPATFAGRHRSSPPPAPAQAPWASRTASRAARGHRSPSQPSDPAPHQTPCCAPAGRSSGARSQPRARNATSTATPGAERRSQTGSPDRCTASPARCETLAGRGESTTPKRHDPPALCATASRLEAALGVDVDLVPAIDEPEQRARRRTTHLLTAASAGVGVRAAARA